MHAITYVRYSTLEQSKGHSLQRQRTDCAAFIARRGWSYSGEEVRDEGLSAYSGANVDKGALGDFLARVKSGEYAPGHVLVVERLDRLSRREPEDVWLLLRDMTQNGMSVATVDGDQLYEAGKSLDMAAILTLVIKGFVSNEESVKKSQRVAAAFAAKRVKLASGHVMTAMVPGWLRKDGDKIVTRPERVAVVQRMFALADMGMGREAIARRLNEENVPVWGRATGWYTSLIKQILTNPAVVGECQPHTKTGHTKRRPVGEPIKGYFPAIVDADLYQRVNNPADLAARKSAGIRKDRLVNVFAGLARCMLCNGPMSYTRKTAVGTVRTRPKAGGGTRSYTRTVAESYLVCDRSRRSLCTAKSRYRYERLREAILDNVLHFSMDDVYFAAPTDLARLKRTLAETEREHSAQHARATKLLKLYSATDDESVEAEWQAARASVKCLEVELTTIRAAIDDARGKVSPEAHIKRVRDVRDEMDSDDRDVAFAARTKVQAALRGTLAGIWFNHDDGVAIDTVGGTRLIVVRGDGSTTLRCVLSPPVTAL